MPSINKKTKDDKNIAFERKGTCPSRTLIKALKELIENWLIVKKKVNL